MKPVVFVIGDVVSTMQKRNSSNNAKYPDKKHVIPPSAQLSGNCDASTYEEELALLPGKYAPPAGRLLLATCDGEYAGCVALRRINERDCTMKRIFPYQRFQGLGLGRALGEAIIGEAQLIGYKRMLLDTSFRQNDAIGLYELADELKEWLVFMELDLLGKVNFRGAF